MIKERYLPPTLEIYKLQGKSRIFQVKSLANFRKTNKLLKRKIVPKIKKIDKILGIEVWLVNGSIIRKEIDVDFTCGGHGYRYLYIPLNEIWIDNALNNEDIIPTVWHEFVEMYLMERGIDYEEAHEYACGLEIGIRQKKEFFLPVGNLNQITNYACGAAALKIVLDYYDKPLTQHTIMQLVETTKEKGTDAKGIVSAAKKLGFKVIWKQGWTIEEIKKSLKKGIPIIVNFQLAHKKGEGHYAVIIGFTKNEFILSDPHSNFSYRKVDIKTFMEHWYELEDNTKREGIALIPN